jgi:2-polyprenyl-3-methyl-5-hydroxy-6-metoxy-1,4-benzoquinol methylase
MHRLDLSSRTINGVSMYDESAWEERYRSRPAVWSGRPNPVLIEEVTDLAPGTALDAGCGEGADAVWLAEHGWQVTAADFAQTALQRAAAHAEGLGSAISDRITWLHTDLTSTAYAGGRYDLVTAQYLQLPGALRETMFTNLARAVAPGGSLLVVGHSASDLQTTVPRPPMKEQYFTALDVAGQLRPDEWEILVAEERPRPAVDPEGNHVTVHDVVLRARKRL